MIRAHKGAYHLGHTAHAHPLIRRQDLDASVGAVNDLFVLFNAYAHISRDLFGHRVQILRTHRQLDR